MTKSKDIINKINDLIPILDSNRDVLLISMLESKLREANSYNLNFDIAELKAAKSELTRHLNMELNDGKVDKIRQIIKRQNQCFAPCKHSVLRVVYLGKNYNKGNYHDEYSDVCKSCINRCDKLDQLAKNMAFDTEFKISCVLTKNVIETKAMLKKISSKLYKIKQNATSKH